MAEIVNLRMARKRKARAEGKVQAAENRALHGRTRAEKQRNHAVEEKKQTFVDGHFLAKPGSEP